LVIDCTTTGAAPPTGTTRPPQRTATWREPRRDAGLAGVGTQSMGSKGWFKAITSR
jgi:hypothetical protein